jgi:NADH:ubiquinone oxidoreductase subunit F (NADH-binding)
MSPTIPANQLPRLLRGVGERPMTELAHHVAVHGDLGDLRDYAPEQITALVEAAGLRGHGGAAFPTARKMRTVAARRKPKVVVANGTEGEPPSKKDRVLLREAPQLVLDGAALAARAVGASQAIVAVSEADDRGAHAVALALEQRRAAGRAKSDPEWALVRTPNRYLAGQESALMSFLNGGPGLPTFGPRPFERGVRGRPTLVQNVETLAHIALIARYGADWFRGLGTVDHPGSTLITVSGAVAAPGVYEIDHGMAVARLLREARQTGPLGGILVGGYFGTWHPASAADELELAGDALARHGAALGAGVVVALPAAACPVAEVSRVAAWFEAEAAGQCGPCINGLDALAYTVGQVALGTASRSDLLRLERWTEQLRGRGTCQHPDGASRFIGSALRVFAADFADHARQGSCERCAHPPVLPAPLPLAMAA